MQKPLTFSADIVVNIPPEKLWPLVSDTDRLNRAVGLPAVSYKMTSVPGGAPIREASARFGFLTAKWREMPFEWIQNEGFSVERLFASGPIQRVLAGCTLTDLGEGRTRVGIFGSFTPKNMLGALAARLMGRKSLNDLVRQVRHFEACELGRTSAGKFARARGRSAMNEHALLDAASKIDHDLKRRILGRFLEYLKDAYDEDVVRMRPFALADQWGENRLDVLKTFLVATRAGILDMRWVPTCPHCRGAKGEVPTLAVLKERGYCDSCDLSFDLNFDEAVEVRFTINPGIRPTVDTVYCIGGPANTRHILAQARIPAGETRIVSVALPPDRYRIRSPQVPGSAWLEWVDSEPRKCLLAAGASGFLPETLLFSGDRAELSVTNEQDTELLLIIEEEAWESKAASAALVTSLQDFRDFFNSEVLSGETELAIKSIAIMFSDLKSSTEMYEKVGDARAYALVREHFVFMAECISNHNGAIVKTIGDAVMAVFNVPGDGVKACLEIQKKVDGFNRRENLCSAICLKLGLHKGPVIAVNSNEEFDYFGGSVNMAARLHGESHGGDIVLSKSIYEDPGVRKVLADQDVVIEPFGAVLKGISETQFLQRVRHR